jgi:hypothetical protein
LISLGLGLMLVIFAGTAQHLRGDDFGAAVAAGVDSFLVSALCFIMMFRNTFAGWYRYLLRPVLLTICLAIVTSASIASGTMNLRNESAAIAIFFIIFPAILFFVILLTPARLFGAPDSARAKARRQARIQETPAGPVSPLKRSVALLLAVLGPCLWACGLQRFYVGKIGSGILWLFTLGLCGVGQLIDIIMIATGQFKDRNDLPLVLWGNRRDRLATPAPGAPQPVATTPQTPATAQNAGEVKAAAGIPQLQPAAYQPPSAPSYTSSGSIIYEPWDPISGLFAALGHILALAGILIGLAVGLRLPAVAVGAWPNAEWVQHLEQVLGPGWPNVVEQTGILLIGGLLFLATILIMIGRRRFGPMHLIRAILGMGGFFWAVTMFRGQAVSTESVHRMIDLFQQNQVGDALQILFGAFSQEQTIVAGVVILLSVLVLAWPPRRRPPVFAPVPNQGVVL